MSLEVETWPFMSDLVWLFLRVSVFGPRENQYKWSLRFGQRGGVSVKIRCGIIVVRVYYCRKVMARRVSFRPSMGIVLLSPVCINSRDAATPPLDGIFPSALRPCGSWCRLGSQLAASGVVLCLLSLLAVN